MRNPKPLLQPKPISSTPSLHSSFLKSTNHQHSCRFCTHNRFVSSIPEKAITCVPPRYKQDIKRACHQYHLCSRNINLSTTRLSKGYRKGTTPVSPRYHERISRKENEQTEKIQQLVAKSCRLRYPNMQFRTSEIRHFHRSSVSQQSLFC